MFDIYDLLNNEDFNILLAYINYRKQINSLKRGLLKMKINDITKNRDVLIQIKLKNYSEYDIIKCVYQNLDSKEISVVELVKEEKEFENKDLYLDIVLSDFLSDMDSDSILRVNKDFEFIQNKYKLENNCNVYYATKRGRNCIWVEK